MRLLQVLPSVHRRFGDEVKADVDFAEALRIYLEHFQTVVIACPVTVSGSSDTGLDRCVSLSGFSPERVEVIELPLAYGLKDFLRHFISTRKVLREEVRKADYIVVSPHTCTSGIGRPSLHAKPNGRGSRMCLRRTSSTQTLSELGWQHDAYWKKFLKTRGILGLFKRSFRRSMRNSQIAVLQGQDVYDAYAAYCPLPYESPSEIILNCRNHL